MRIDLRGWESEGLRCPDVCVKLDAETGKPSVISLIQMPNGTGKTTTLELMKAALNGEAKNWEPDKVKSYAQKNTDLSKLGRFLVNLYVNSSPLTIELILNFENGQARYFTTNPGSGGRTAGWAPPPTVHRFLTPQFLDLFVFDGELANKLLDSKHAEAERAIDALCQLYLLDEISLFSTQKWEEATKYGPKTTQGLKQYDKKRGKVLKRISVIDKARLDTEKRIAVLDDEITALDLKISGHIGGIESTKGDYQTAELALTTTSSEVQLLSGNLMELIRQPQLLHQQIFGAFSELKDNLDHLKLPENSSAQFFEELIDEVDCICGREMTDDAIKTIKARSKDYLGTEEAGIINALKQDINQYATASNDKNSERLNTAVSKLTAAARDQKKAEQSVSALKKKLIAQGDEELQEWEKKLEDNNSDLIKLKALLRSIKAPKKEEEDEIEKIFSLLQLKSILGETEKKISEITGTLELRAQTELITEITDQARLVARNKIRTTLLDECNTRLQSVLADNPVQLEKIDRSLKLEGQDAASVGQTLSVGYVFLMSVLNRGENEFPLIIDSPAGPLDAARRRVIGGLIPELCSQFIGFTISTERLGFVEALEESGVSVNYLTIFRKTLGTESLISELPDNGVTETENAVLVFGKEYFNQFDLSEEPQNGSISS